MGERMQFRKTSMGATVTAIGSRWRRILLLMVVPVIALSTFAKAEAQLPEAPTAAEIAPLKRYSLTVGLESTYSLTTSLDNLTSKLGVSIRIGQRETLGFSYSHATVMNEHHMQNNSVVASLNFRAWSWGRIPVEH